MMEGLVFTRFRLINAQGESYVRQISLEAAARHALRAVGRGAENLGRATPIFIAAISVGERLRLGDVPRVGTPACSC